MNAPRLSAQACSGWYVGLLTDPRCDPMRLTQDFDTIAEASAARTRLKDRYQDCQIFAVPQ